MPSGSGGHHLTKQPEEWLGHLLPTLLALKATPTSVSVLAARIPWQEGQGRYPAPSDTLHISLLAALSPNLPWPSQATVLQRDPTQVPAPWTSGHHHWLVESLSEAFLDMRQANVVVAP